MAKKRKVQGGPTGQEHQAKHQKVLGTLYWARALPGAACMLGVGGQCARTCGWTSSEHSGTNPQAESNQQNKQKRAEQHDQQRLDLASQQPADDSAPSTSGFRNKEKVLIVGSRGNTFRCARSGQLRALCTE